MSNPIFSDNTSFNSSNQQSNTLMGMYNKIRHSSNPNKEAQDMLINNPDFKDIVQYINQNCGNPKTAFYNMAAQKGVDPNSILSMLW